MLGAWLTELLTGPLSKLKEPCDGVAKLHAFVGKTNRASAAYCTKVAFWSADAGVRSSRDGRWGACEDAGPDGERAQGA